MAYFFKLTIQDNYLSIEELECYYENNIKKLFYWLQYTSYFNPIKMSVQLYREVLQENFYFYE